MADRRKKLLVVGGGPCQLAVIRRIKELGHTSIVADYEPNCAGAGLGDIYVNVSTFDRQGLERTAREHDVQGIIVVGTDQPVLIAAEICAALGLPSPVGIETALRVTDKKKMKQVLVDAKIPVIPFRLLGRDHRHDALEGLTAPYVIKPLDSQGQRGVFKLNSPAEISREIDTVLSYSGRNEVMVEEYYPSLEITLSGWVQNGRTHILTVTDRVTHQDPKFIGICLGHLYPSRFLRQYKNEIELHTRRIAEAFGIRQGPIYIQCLIGKDGLLVNEVAARIGGAYEDIFIPVVTGFDLLHAYIDTVLGNGTTPANLPPGLRQFETHVAAQLFFLREGIVSRSRPARDLEDLPGVLGAYHAICPGFQALKITTAGQRAGYVLVHAESREELETMTERVWREMGIVDAEGNPMVLPFITPRRYANRGFEA